MRFSYSKLGLDLNIEENRVLVFYVEDAKAFSDMVSSVWNQVNGSIGEVSLYESEKEYTIPKIAECIINPFAVDINDKRILGALYKEISGVCGDKYQERAIKTNAELIDLLDKMTSDLPYPIDFSTDLDLTSILKAYEVKIETNYDSLAEKMAYYMDARNQLCGINYFIAVNLKQFIPADELKEFYKSLFYKKINLIDIESNRGVYFPCEKEVVIDKDLCVIELN